MFNFRSLGSGSSGNSYLFQTDLGFFMIDAGVGIRKLKRYMVESGVTLARLQALFLTHDHSDHSRNAGLLQSSAQKIGHELPLYATSEVIDGINSNPTITKKPLGSAIHHIQKGSPIECCGCSIIPFDVPHDSRDNVGYFLTYQGTSLCLLTDVGAVTPEILNYVSKTSLLILESNYDCQLLANGPYPEFLRRRIAGSHGHLCNDQAAEIVFQHRDHLARVWLCHLSENNNNPQRATDTFLNKFSDNGLQLAECLELHVLPRTMPSALFLLDSAV